MSKLDAYLRSIEKFGASGAVLTSNQAVTLRFPTGDRHATQVTPHDLLVAMVREVATPQAFDAVDRQRPTRFDYESQGVHYSISVVPRPGVWQVTIEGAAPAAAVSAPPPVRSTPAAAITTGELLIERGQYDAPVETARVVVSGSAWLDELTHAARAARATDLYLGAAAQAIQRVGATTTAFGAAIDGDQLAREIGVVAPAAARAAWTEGGAAVFAYGDGMGRVRATLARDHRGPTVALRLLPDEAPLERLGLDVGDWLDRAGLVVIGGPSGTGKTVTLAALVRALGAKQRRVVALEQPIELVQSGPWISQREIGTHAATVGEGVAAAMRENADAIAIGIDSQDAAVAALDAAAGGHLVLVTVVAPMGGLAVERLIDRLPADRRDLARVVLQATLLGSVSPILTRAGWTFEVTRPGERRA